MTPPATEDERLALDVLLANRQSDDEVYTQGSLRGGLGYTDAQLRAIWGDALCVESIRPMVKPAPDSGLFGEPFLWVMWAQKVQQPHDA